MELDKGKAIMEYLRPNGGWVIYGEDFESILYFDGCEPIAKDLFDDTLAEIENIVEAKQAEQRDAKAALLDRLGISADEAKLFLA
jgi:hypothetical protein